MVPTYDFALPINGQASAKDDIFDVVNPATGELFAKAPHAISAHIDNVDDAIDCANSSSFGLGGSIWGSDSVRGEDKGQHLEVGTAGVNQPSLPFGGTNNAGVGVEYSELGLLEYSVPQVVSIWAGIE